MTTWSYPTKSPNSSTTFFELEIGGNFKLFIGSSFNLRIGGSSVGGDGWTVPNRASTSWTYATQTP